MKVDALFDADLARWADVARQAEDAEFDGVMSPELSHDPFLPLALAAPATSSVELITGIAVAFARNPMTVAMTASDVHRLSGGRMVLGIGSQVRAHITRRYSMPWSRPAARMREFILAMRAVWSAWNEGTPLSFEGEFYTHNLMTDIFRQRPSEFGAPRVSLAAVGPAMTSVAGEVADGLLLHGFTTDSYIREVTLPRLEQGLARAGRSRGDIEVTVPPMATVVAPGKREEQVLMLRAQIGFYGSTPAYRPVMEHHGWGELADELYRRSKAGDWASMAELVNDDVFNTFAFVTDDPDELGSSLAQRFDGIVDRIQVGFDPANADRAAKVAQALRRGCSAGAEGANVGAAKAGQAS